VENFYKSMNTWKEGEFGARDAAASSVNRKDYRH
jgi:hypothetical protein